MPTGRGKQFTGNYSNDFSQKIEVEGLLEFLAQVKTAMPEVAKQVAEVNKKAADIVKDAAAAKAESIGSTAAQAAQSLATSNATRQSSVRLGRGAPYAFGAEFGAKRYNQFKPWTGNQWVSGSGPAGGVGYFLYPAIREQKEKVETEYMASMLALMRIAGFRVTESGGSD